MTCDCPKASHQRCLHGYVYSLKHGKMTSLKQTVLQILMGYSLVEVVRLDWAQVESDSSQAKQIAGHIALRNYALLVHRLESEVAASQLRASLSGNAHLTLGHVCAPAPAAGMHTGSDTFEGCIVPT